MWKESYQSAFEDLKKKLITTLVLHGHKWKLPFHMYTNISNKSLGVVLVQNETLAMYAIYCINKNLAKVEHNYTMIEKKFLVLCTQLTSFTITSLGIVNLCIQIIQQLNI
jgi:hypothetical protein